MPNIQHRRYRTHLIIPDTQVEPDVYIDHMEWIGRYISEYKPDVVVHLGDHWDMPSLCQYDRIKPRKMEGRRFVDDVAAGNEAMQELVRNIKRSKHRPEMHFLIGNHEERIERAIDADPYQLERVFGYECLDLSGWTVHNFREVAEIDGIWYSHYFYRWESGTPYSSQPMTRLKEIGNSFTQGHQQGLSATRRTLATGITQRALIAGSCYLHEPEYLGPQAEGHWRGIIVKHETRNGNYDLMEVSLDYLCRRYTGYTLEEYLSD